MARLVFVLGIVFVLGAALSACAGGLDDARAGLSAHEHGNHDLAIRYYTRAIQSGKLSSENLVAALNNRGSAYRE